MKFIKKPDAWLSLLIFALALLIRFYRLDVNTPPLYADETGHYVLRNLVLGDSKSWTDLYHKIFYGTFSFTWLFGLSPFGVRSASALYGALSCLAVYYLAISVGRNRLVAVVAAMLTAFSPWNFLISRLGHTHVVIIVLLTAISTSLFIRAKNIKTFLLGYVFLFLSLAYYPSMVVIVPIVALTIFPFVLSKFSIRKRSVVVAGTIILAVTLAYLSVKKYGVFDIAGRGLDLAIWRDINTPYEIDKYRGLSWYSEPTLFSFGLPPEQLSNKLVYNRPVANAGVFVKNYLSFFSPDWLFLRGDPILRHSTGQVGTLYLFLLPFLLYGAFKFFNSHDRRTRLIFLVWILVSPIPAAITKDGAGYLLRAVTLLPFLTYFCALGLIESLSLIRKNWRWLYGFALVLVGLYSIYYFFYGYFHVYPALSARSYESGFKELSDFQSAHNNAPMLVIWDGYYHHGNFRFWQKTPFPEYQAFSRKQLVYGESTFWQTWPNLYFSSLQSITDYQAFLNENPVDYVVLPDRYFVKYPEEIKEQLTIVEEIKYPDQTTALEIYKPQ